MGSEPPVKQALNLRKGRNKCGYFPKKREQSAHRYARFSQRMVKKKHHSAQRFPLLRWEKEAPLCAEVSSLRWCIPGCVTGVSQVVYTRVCNSGV